MTTRVKTLLAVVVTIILVSGIISWLNWAPRTGKAEAADFQMEASSGDSQGIDPAETLLLSSTATVNEKILRRSLTVFPQVELTIKREDTAGKSFKVTPAKPLEPGKVYSFKLAYGEGRSYQWAFQTKSKFRVLGSLPRNEATAVPINTGIELVLSHEGFDAPASYFSIEPKVPGRFEIHKKTLVFIPKKSLDNGTVYKVSLKAGLPLKGSDQVLEQDWKFSFETEAPSASQKTSFEIFQNTSEFVPTEPPFFQVYVAEDGKQGPAVPVNVTVYQYPGSQLYIKALRLRDSLPWWANYGRSTYRSGATGLQQITAFKTEARKMNQLFDTYVVFPKPLPAGYYLAQFQVGTQSRQVLFQVTEVSAHVTVAVNKTLVWLHDLATQEPLAGAKVGAAGGKAVSSTDEGIAILPTPSELTVSPDDQEVYLQVKDSRGRELVAPLAADRYRPLTLSDDYRESSKYWKYLYLDRGLYLPTDTVRFWGILMPRDADATGLTRVQARLTRWESSTYSDGAATILLEKEVTLQEHNFTGELKLPGLKPGYYQFQITSGTKVLLVQGMEVKIYTKPAYKIAINADQKAVFAGDTVRYDVRASFFEGTPVAGIKMGYNTSRKSGSISADAQGQAEVIYKPIYEDNGSLYEYHNFNVHASLPEAGEITGESGVMVFPNDVQLQYTQKVENDQAILDLQLNRVELDRYNRDQEDSPEKLLGAPVAGKEITGYITEQWWEQIADGEYYDIISKTVQKSYRYEPRTRTVSNFTVTTGPGGKAGYSFPLGDKSYEVKLVTNDQRGQKLHRIAYFQGKGYREPGQDNYRYYHLEPKDQEKTSYRARETVALAMWENNAAMENKSRSFLFFTARQGLLDYQVQDSSLYTFQFLKKYIPNIFAKGIYFDGKGYHEAYEFNTVFDRAEKALQVEVRPDREVYRPGDRVGLKVSVHDGRGNPQQAKVNLNLVDEALFALQDQHVDLLQSLYQDYVPPLILTAWSSHKVPVPAGGAEMGGEGGGARKLFQDAVYFGTLTTGKNGQAETSILLPDNLTSWRITYQAFTGDLQAGSGTRPLPVKLPFFVEMTANGTYLAKDQPQVIFRSYGEKLKQSDKVTYRVRLVGPGGVTTEMESEGEAFQPTNIKLPSLNNGGYTLTVTAIAPGAMKDTLQKGFTVLDSYLSKESVNLQLLQQGLKPVGNGNGITTLVFTDLGRGQYYQVLQNFRFGWGNRLEQKLATQLATKWLNDYFREEIAVEDWEPMQYQTPDGGLAVLPYSNSDLGLSARTAALKDGGFDTGALIIYFNKILDDPDTDREQAALALWGLSALEEPVLSTVNKLLEQGELSLKEQLYLTLASLEMGNGEEARKVYKGILQRYGQERGSLYRLDSGRDQDEVLEVTSLAAVIAAKLNRPEQDRMFKYLNENYPQEMLVHLETLLYLKEVLPRSGGEGGRFTYVLDGKETSQLLKAGQRVSLILNPQQMQQIRFMQVSGRVGMTTIYTKGYRPGEQGSEKEISLSRTYRGASDPGGIITGEDLIKVTLAYRIPAKSPDGLYLVTDYLPSGLKPVERPQSWGERPEKEDVSYPLEIDGQKITFMAGKGGGPLTYYARVMSPGEYTAEGATISHGESGAVMGLTSKERVIIH